MFGGIDGETGVPMNDIYRFRPHFSAHKSMLSDHGDYRKLVKPEFTLMAEKLECAGIPPLSRA